MTEIRILAEEFYDGVTPVLQSQHLVVLRDGLVCESRTATTAERKEPETLHVPLVTPGAIDIQINGAADAQFNFEPTPETISRIARGARQGGTAHILPTFITARGQSYLGAISAARQAMAAGMPGVAGVHLEGPFLSPARPGIHDPSSIRPLVELDVVALEREAADFPGTLLLTLAPECQEPDHLRRLSAAGLVLFAGHSEAAPEHLGQMRGATHLWNAMPGIASRAPGIVSEVLGGNRLFAGLIADGHHVGRQALSLSVRAAADRLCLVTDAMLTLAGSCRDFELNDRPIKLSGGRLTGADGTLAGAHIAMDESIRHLIEITGCDAVTALRMATANPAKALGRERELGTVRLGTTASLSLFDKSLAAIGVVTQGRLFPREEYRG